MQLRYTILYVENVPAAMAFYERAFGLSTRMRHESNDYGELETGTTRLAFSSLSLMAQLGKQPGRAREQQPSFEIAFETDNVPAALARAVEQGATLVQEITEMPWGQTISYVRDPDGFLVEICSPVDNLTDAGEQGGNCVA